MTTSLHAEGTVRDELAAFFEPRAAAVDHGVATVREGVAFAQARALDGDERCPNADLARVARTIASIAWSDLASAFSLWSHRMVLEYLSLAPEGSIAPTLRRSLLETERLGSSALAGPLAHQQGQAVLPLRAVPVDGGAFILDGPIRWASNLFVPDFVIVSAARSGPDLVVFALTGDTPGLTVDPGPRLVALQATGSSSLRLDGVRVAREALVAPRFAGFAPRIRPTFLILQSAFCWGLARRSLDEVAPGLRGPATIFRDEATALATEAARLSDALLRAADGPRPALRELVQLRLDAACLATSAVALEVKVAGSRSYVADSATARRLREAAFLPIQAPTEAQLRTELATPS